MAEVAVSALLRWLFDKLTSEALKNIARNKGIDAKIENLRRSLPQIQGLLADASRKEITSQDVKRWLNDLQHLAYDIDDVLDDLATEDMEEEYASESETFRCFHENLEVRKLVSCVLTYILRRPEWLYKLDTISNNLQKLLDENVSLGLREIEAPRPRNNNQNRRFQSSVFDPSRIVGRQAEKKEWVQQLLQEDGPSHQNFGIVPIFGMGGVGKTTLARLLYDDQQVKKHFELKGWVCISDDFDIFGRTKDMFKDLGGELKKEHENFNKLHEALRDYVRGKRFLLVLDDVWFESYRDWQNLVEPLFTCAPGSKIVITTRKDQLLRRLGYDPLNKQLECLSYDDALSLFALHALGVKNFDSHLSLKPHGEGIVKKCGRLPLALITLGTSLRTKEDEDSWKGVLESEIWNLRVEKEIFRALRLSYHELSAPLKQVFAYCSLFPKDFLFDKEELVSLWMAEGFLQQSTQNHPAEEKLGREYFDELLSRSFFQYAPNSESLFVMHDLMNDFATHVAGEFFVRLDIEANDTTEEMLKKYRHMSFVREKYITYKKFEAFKRAKSLRTFLATSFGVVDGWKKFYLSNKIMVDLLSELPLLRVLSLSKFQISEIPESICTLRHLRYLNLSLTAIKYLPENVSNLYNLETLILFGCKSLSKLPNNFLKLKNLRHLDIRETPCLDQMPLGIGELKSLQTLSKIIIGGKSMFEITKLINFENLCGEVSIEGLQNVTDARVVNLPQKRLSKLEFVWSDMWDDSRNEMLEKDVLNELMPRNDKLLTKLKIRSYGGSEFPKWVGDPLFVHLNHVSLSGCKRCTYLPPLAQLKSLKKLFIEGLDAVTEVDMKLLGTCHGFPSLEVLSFHNMRMWWKWSTSNGVDVFPRLKVLFIEDCPNLIEVRLEKIHSLRVLMLGKCDNRVLRRMVEIGSYVTELIIENIAGLNDVVWRGVIDHLRAVKYLRIWMCNEISYLWESEAVASKVLVNLTDMDVRNCDNLVSLGEKEYDEDSDLRIVSLRTFRIFNCKNMDRCRCPDSIENLVVKDCKSIKSISLPGGGGIKFLEIQGFKKLLEREWGGKNNNRKRLEYVRINDWPNLKSIINLNCLVHLNRLEIYDCEGLESLPDNEFPNLTSLKHLSIRSCPRMDGCFPRGLWPPNLQTLVIGRLKKPISEWGTQNFPTFLVDLTLYGDSGGEDGAVISSCSQISNLLPSSLTSLQLYDFEKLESFSMGLELLQFLYFENCPNLHKLSHPQRLSNPLQHLTFNKCPNMKDLPEELLPSLLSLNIKQKCPILKEIYSKGGGSYSPLISHIPHIDIYPEEEEAEDKGEEEDKEEEEEE